MTSLWWRYSRSEELEQSSKNFFTFCATPLEAENKQFNLRYNCTMDMYVRFLIDAADSDQLQLAHTYTKWQTCAYSWENVARKEEHDHRMVYLAKADVADAHKINGLIEWQFDFSNQGLTIKSADLSFGTMLYRDGKVDVDILHDGDLIIRKRIEGEIIPNNPLTKFRKSRGRRLPNIYSLQNLDSFSIRAKLTGNKGAVVYQNAQIFRQSITDVFRHPFELKIKFN